MAWTGDKATMLCLRIFEHIRKRVRYDSEAMELIVCSHIIRQALPTKEDDQRIWLSFMDKENQ